MNYSEDMQHGRVEDLGILKRIDKWPFWHVTTIFILLFRRTLPPPGLDIKDE